MADSQMVEMPWGTYAAGSTTEVFVPAGGWVPTRNVQSARGWGELRNRTGLFQARPAVQVANDVRSPGTVTAVGAMISADGVSDPTAPVSISSSTTSKYMRVGWLVSLTSGNTLGTGALAGVVEFNY